MISRSRRCLYGFGFLVGPTSGRGSATKPSRFSIFTAGSRRQPLDLRGEAAAGSIGSSRHLAADCNRGRRVTGARSGRFRRRRNCAIGAITRSSRTCRSTAARRSGRRSGPRDRHATAAAFRQAARGRASPGSFPARCRGRSSPQGLRPGLPAGRTSRQRRRDRAPVRLQAAC